jgi:hypothetical protein
MIPPPSHPLPPGRGTLGIHFGCGYAALRSLCLCGENGLAVAFDLPGAICGVTISNKHAGLLKGRKSLYPKLKQY